MGPFNQRGFSLIEIMVALVILSVGILSLAAMQRQFIQASVRIQARGEALSVAESQLAVLLTMPANELSSESNPESGELTIQGTSINWHLAWRIQTLEVAKARIIKLTVSGNSDDVETLKLEGWRLD